MSVPPLRPAPPLAWAALAAALSAGGCREAAPLAEPPGAASGPATAPPSSLDARLTPGVPASAEAAYYRIEPIPLPPDVILEVGGLAFTPSGALMACTRRGEIWALEGGPGLGGGTPRWTRFASGLHEALGIWPASDDAPGGSTALAAKDVYVVQRPELTRVRDTDGDGVADRYESVCAAWSLSGQYHEFAYGPVRDREGNFWGTLNLAFHRGDMGDASVRWRGWCFKITPSGEFVPWATGLRSPNGIGFDLDGELFVTDNQGDFVGTGPLFHVTRGAFLGHPAGLLWDERMRGRGDPTRRPAAGWPTQLPVEELNAMRKRPAVQFPHGPMGQSLSQPLCDATGGKFGPFAGQMLVGDQSKCTVMRAALERVSGEIQGACFPFRGRFVAGVNRMAFAPDGSLWVGGTDRGWGSAGGRPYGLERLVWTGRTPMEILTMTVSREGFDLRFTKPVDPATAGNPSAYSLHHYYYYYRPIYGSPQVDPRPVPVKEVRISDGGARVALVLPELVPRRVYELHVDGLRAADGSPLLHPVAYYTLNRTLTENAKSLAPASGGKPAY